MSSIRKSVTLSEAKGPDRGYGPLALLGVTMASNGA